jgi:signal transduction histidine kinase
MFEMFFKNAKSRGSGLGLYMVKSAVERLNGSISAHSETNNGTTVKITLPLK